MILFTWTLTALSMIGVILNARKRVSGFWFWAVANAGWVIVNYWQGLWAQAVLFGFYLLACLYGIWVWRRGE
jgi:nicotinamide riboside transporter PnuC